MTRDNDELIARYVELDPQRPWPEEAYLRDSGVSVWAVIGDLDVQRGDLEQVAADHAILVEAVQAAIRYYFRHKAVIDAQIQANRTAPAA